MIFVEDHSTDRTREVIEGLVAEDQRCRAVYHDRNKGRGKAFYSGAAIARGEIVGFVDIDLEVNERYIPDMLRAIHQGAEVATARRRIKLGARPYDLLRHAMSLGYASLYRQLLRLPTRDPETGFKFFRREALKELFEHATAAGWFWDSEAMAYSTLLGFRIAEVPCEFVRRADKRSSVRLFSSTVQQTRELVRFARLLHRRRRAARVLNGEVRIQPAWVRRPSLPPEHRDRLPVSRFVEVVRGPIVARELSEGLRAESHPNVLPAGIRQPRRERSERREVV
jgi:glycosyltransferase involved in cell wall biosynthesis